MTSPSALLTNNARSAEIMARARGRFPGGVNSPVRAFRGVGGEPVVAARGKGARVWDADGNEYIDYVLSWGPLVLGHAPDVVLEEVARVMQLGTSFGMPTEREVELADRIAERMPHLEMVRFTSSGTEAAMSIARLARAITKREYILKFEGCYHGHADAFLVKAGSGVATLGLPDSPGVPDALAKLTLTCAYNDLEAVERIAREVPLAAIMLEPIVGNGGYIEPTADFIPGLRRIADETGALLVFDEVMTGFRIAYGGAAERFGVTPDLTALGKVIGGGLPVAAYGGKREFMEHIAPTGPVYQAGTLSGNPLAMAGGLATLRALTREVHDGITVQTANLVQGMRDLAARHGVPFTASHSGSMWGFFFRDGVVRTFEEAKTCDVALFKRFFHAARRRGVSLAPSAFEAAFMSAAHGPADIAETLNRLDDALGAALAQTD
ncbi:glutamate-1-semialdehyde 2,1-aminomutase [Gemmatimonas sp.]|uniref:glutamate-1-semialdehyde 2,1-aminomutase n=1 Tax=Gemmatimonas sp. TaxID=1962908 RepID=UPI00391CF49C